MVIVVSDFFFIFILDFVVLFLIFIMDFWPTKTKPVILAARTVDTKPGFFVLFEPILSQLLRLKSTSKTKPVIILQLVQLIQSRAFFVLFSTLL